MYFFVIFSLFLAHLLFYYAVSKTEITCYMLCMSMFYLIFLKLKFEFISIFSGKESENMIVELKFKCRHN